LFRKQTGVLMENVEKLGGELKPLPKGSANDGAHGV
jgi:hypothetical protein